jgi:hypothetical protein
MATKNQVLSLQAVHDDRKNVIFITENSDSEEDQEEAQHELQLSMHALCGMKSAAHTFTVSIQVGKHYATALVDTSSTTTFMTPQFATLTASPTTSAKKMEVAVANGQSLWTKFSCLNFPYTIQGTPFTSDFRLLQLKGYDVILGSDWVKQYSPVTLDYKKMTLCITLAHNTTVTFRDESSPSSSVIQESVKLQRLLEGATCGAVLFLKPLSMDSHADSSQHPLILQLLDEYYVLFSEPHSLPPKRDCDHTIPLMPEAKL